MTFFAAAAFNHLAILPRSMRTRFVWPELFFRRPKRRLGQRARGLFVTPRSPHGPEVTWASAGGSAREEACLLPHWLLSLALELLLPGVEAGVA